MAEDKFPYTPDVAVPPGATLRETLETLGLTQAELAMRTGRPLKTINEIVQGKAAITPDTAIQLERVLDIPASFWNARERTYRERLARLKAREDLRGQVAEASLFPYAAMAREGWIAPTRDKLARVESLLLFFGVASLESLPAVHAAAFRIKAREQADGRALATWLRRGELQARKIESAPFDADRLVARLNELVNLTREDPSVWSNEVVNMCASSGLAVVFVPHLPKTRVHGATRWLGGNRPVVQMTIRGKYEDIFWFSFFHELGHILLHGKRETFLESDSAAKTAKECEADAFAAETLIPAKEFDSWIDDRYFSPDRVNAFAAQLGIAPGIVVGRLQYEGLVPYSNLNRLRRKLVWAGSNR